MSGLPQLPEFHLLLVPEPAAPDPQALRADEQQHIAALLARYEQEEGSLQVGYQACCPSVLPDAAEQVHCDCAACPYCLVSQVCRRHSWVLHLIMITYDARCARMRVAEQVEEASGSGAAEGTWAGEGYEKASQLSADTAFHRYAKQLRRQPGQCLRLAGGAGKLLWPQSTPPSLHR